jgi:hypothetical protein
LELLCELRRLRCLSQTPSNSELPALTLLVAESDPANKETIIRLVMNRLARDEMSEPVHICLVLMIEF